MYSAFEPLKVREALQIFGGIKCPGCNTEVHIWDRSEDLKELEKSLSDFEVHSKNPSQGCVDFNNLLNEKLHGIISGKYQANEVREWCNQYR